MAVVSCRFQAAHVSYVSYVSYVFFCGFVMRPLPGLFLSVQSVFRNAPDYHDSGYGANDTGGAYMRCVSVAVETVCV